MAEKSTWVKLDRNIIRWGWYQDANTMRVFVHLILTANIKENEFMGVKIHRGEVATSFNSLAKALGITYDQSRIAVNHLKQTGEITITRHSKFLVISIQNYNRYQLSDPIKSQSNPNHIPIKSQQSNNNKNFNKKKNIPTLSRDWEDDLGVPEEFKGRFRDEHDWLEFIGEVSHNEI